ncbi:MAG TPA: hypothetical protein VNJ46_01670 [Gaiellaceae bacterium]|nr:hypothetical protein [Gaiellaceae bacterium]
MSAQGPPTGPLGKPRGIGFGILLFVVTVGLYSLSWAYTTHAELRPRTEDGLGGQLGLAVRILAWPVSAFLIPAETGRMYRRDGRTPPVTGWTGLWLFPGSLLVLPALV